MQLDFILKKNYRFLFVMVFIAIMANAFADSLSYSGRLVNSNGSPVVGPVNLKFELASTADTNTILCSQQISNVALTNGVFHVKLDLNCGAPSLSQVLGAIVAPDTAAIRVTNESPTPDKVYSFQSLHAVPAAQIAHGLAKLNANNNEVLTWTGSKWEPKPVSGATGGTVTSIVAGSGLSGGTITNSGTIAIASGGVTDSHLAGSIARSKLVNGTANYVLINNGSGGMSEVAQLPLALGGTGSSTAAGARTNLGLGTAAITDLGYATGNALPADNIPVCLPTQKLQFTGIGPTYWGCATDYDTTADATKLPLAGGTMSGAINMGNSKITNLATPTVSTDAATMGYVDSKLGGASQWTTAGSDIYYNTGNVGIGVLAPAYKLDVAGDINITGSFKVNGINISTTGTSPVGAFGGMYSNGAGSFVTQNNPYTSAKSCPAGFTARGLGSGGYQDASNNFASFDFYYCAANGGAGGTAAGLNGQMQFNSSGLLAGANMYYVGSNVGIGNSTPAEKLDVTGNIALDGSLRLKSDSGNFVTMKAPNSLGATFNYTWPLTAPTAGQVLSSNAAGVLSWISPTASPITTVFGRTGAVTATAGDYSGSMISNTPAGTIAATSVQGAIDELAVEKQNTDATLTSLASYNTNGILVQTAADTFTGRSIAGVANRTTVTNGDGVSGNPTVNVDTTLLPSPVAGDSGKFLKASGANASSWMALASGDITTALGFTPINKAGDSLNSGSFIFSGTSLLQNANSPVNLTDVTNKQYVDNLVAAGSNQWTYGSGNVYRASGNVGIGTTTPGATLAVQNSLLSTASPYSATVTPSQLLINDAPTNSTGKYSSLSILTQPSPSASGTTHFHGLMADVKVPASSTSNMQQLRAAYLNNENNGSGSLANQTSVIGNSSNYGSGVITTQMGGNFSANTSSGTVTNQYGVNATANHAGTTNITAQHAARAQAMATSGTVTSQYGVLTSAVSSSSATATSQWGTFSSAVSSGTSLVASSKGVYGQAFTDSSAGITDAYGVHGEPWNGGAGTITNAYALFGNVYKPGTGSITNGYGLYLGNIEAANKWSIYANDPTAPSYFAAKVGVGTNAPASILHVSGTSTEPSLWVNAKTQNDGSIVKGVTVAPVINTNVDGSLGIGLTPRLEPTANLSTIIYGNILIPRLQSTSANIPGRVSGNYFRVDTDASYGGNINAINVVEIGAMNKYGSGSISSVYGLRITDQSGGTTNYGIHQDGTDDLNFFGGKVGIGASTPQHHLHIQGDASGSTTAAIYGPDTVQKGLNFGVDATNRWAIGQNSAAGGRNMYFYQDHTGAGGIISTPLVLSANSMVGINNTNPAYTVDISGDIRITGTPYRNGGDVGWIVPSDKRLKDVTGKYEYGLKEVASLETIKFRYKKGNKKEISSKEEYTGVIAQEVQKQIPDAVKKDKDGFLSLNTTPIFWAMVNSIKELFSESKEVKREIASIKAENKSKDEEIEKLKRENAEIKARLDRLEQSLSSK